MRFSLPLAVALLVASCPLSASANRPNTRPHHRVPANFRKYVAPRAISLPIADYTGSSSSASITLVGGLSSGASFTTGITDYANLVKTGAGTASLGGTLTLMGGNTYTGASTVNAGSLLTLGNATLSSGITTTANLGTTGTGIGTATLGGTLLVDGGSSAATTTVNSGTLTINTGILSGGVQIGNSATSANSSLLTVLNTYTGTISLTNPVLPDAGNLSLHTGATLALNFTGTDTIGQLQIDGVAQVAGVWGSLTSDAPNKTALITGSGTLTVATTTLVTTPATAPAASGAGIEFASQPITSAPEIQADSAISGAASAEPAPVPEPSSALLFLAGAGLLVRRPRRA